MRVLWEGECVKLGIIVESREQFEPLASLVRDYQWEAA